MNGYEWLKNEIEIIKRKKFHVLDHSSVDLTDIERTFGALPVGYKDFVRHFGRAKLFRSPWNGDGYCLMVVAPPIIQKSPDAPQNPSVVRLKIGYYVNTGNAWLECAEGKVVQCPIYVGFLGQRRKAANSFEEWLKRSYSKCKTLYSMQDWASLTKPVAPFTLREQQIVEAIKKFEFHKAGVTSNGNILVNVKNKSSMTLTHFTIGVRDKTGMTGASALNVSEIAPGTSAAIEQPMYKGSMDPNAIDLFRLPVPEPEDRAYYAELREKNAK